MTTAGKLDRRVQFQRATTSDDGFTQVETFANHGSPVWAEKTEVSDAERWRAGEVAASITCRFRVRYSAFSAGITPKDRLTCEGRTYDISGIKEIERREGFEITAAARVDQ
jgi:SPP1 family predicted phage head-tail adaptor